MGLNCCRIDFIEITLLYLLKMRLIAFLQPVVFEKIHHANYAIKRWF